MAQLQKFANVLWIFILCGVVLSGSVYQVIRHENPCPLCLLERLGMLGTAVAVLLNLRFGMKVEHYALAILASIGGRFVSLRQIALHVCPEFPSFGTPVFGYDLYIWAYIVFNCSVIAAAILLIIFGFSEQHHKEPTWDFWGKSVSVLLACALLINFITVLDLCGLSPCAG